MVRLKDYYIKSPIFNNFISIPYGAIKSQFAFPFCITTALISIPYGAIKSLSAYLLTPVTTSFQFLMVRLKV